MVKLILFLATAFFAHTGLAMFDLENITSLSYEEFKQI